MSDRSSHVVVSVQLVPFSGKFPLAQSVGPVPNFVPGGSGRCSRPRWWSSSLCLGASARACTSQRRLVRRRGATTINSIYYVFSLAYLSMSSTGSHSPRRRPHVPRNSPQVYSRTRFYAIDVHVHRACKVWLYPVKKSSIAPGPQPSPPGPISQEIARTRLFSQE